MLACAMALESQTGSLATILRGQARDVDGFVVSRVLPALTHKLLGPFCFFDHLGPRPAGRARLGRAPSPAYRSSDGYLCDRRRDHPPRQFGLRTTDPTGRGELDDSRTRHYPFGANFERVAAKRVEAPRSSALGSSAHHA